MQSGEFGPTWWPTGVLISAIGSMFLTLPHLLLLTFSGLAQLAPAMAAALGRRRLLSTGQALLGMATGVAVVIWMTFFELDIADTKEGIVGLVSNIAVAAVAQAVVGLPRPAPGSGTVPKSPVTMEGTR